MNFHSYVSTHQVSEWTEYYINYKVLHSLLGTIKQMLQTEIKSEEPYTLNMLDKEFLTKAESLYFAAFQDQISLFSDFLHYKFDIRLKKRFSIIDYNLRSFASKSLEPNQRKAAWDLIKTALLKYYKEICLFKSYINLNENIYYKLYIKYINMTKEYGIYERSKKKSIKQSFENCRSNEILKSIDVLLTLIESTVLLNFYSDGHIGQGKKELKKLSENTQFTLREAGWLGLGLGICSISFIIVILLMIETDFFSEKETDFIRYQFPIFRGSFVLFFGIFIYGLTIYLLNRLNINFKKALNIQIVYTNAFHIMISSFVLLAVWLLIFIYGGISYSNDFKTNGVFFNNNVAQYLPPLVWIFFFAFILFPSKTKLFGNSRWFLVKTIGRVIIGPLSRISFLTEFALHQFTSLTITLKDLAYTCCYIVNLFSTGSMQNTCETDSFRYVLLMAILLATFYKICFILNQFYFLLRYETNLITFKETLIRYLINFFRNITIIATTLVAFFSKNSSAIYGVWIGLSIFSSVYSLLWDIKYEWGFLNNKAWLRDTRAFRSHWVYYILIVIYLAMRYAWTITLSPAIIQSNYIQGIVILTVAIVEIIRRMIWNIFKMEAVHVKFKGKFRSMNEDDLPFAVEIDFGDTEINKMINYQFKVYLRLAATNKVKNKKMINSQLKACNEKLDLLIEKKNEVKINYSYNSNFTSPTYYFIKEEDQEAGLKECNKSIETCKSFVNSHKFILKEKKKNLEDNRNRRHSAEQLLVSTEARMKIHTFEDLPHKKTEEMKDDNFPADSFLMSHQA
jgi:hypothetical protein